MPPEERRRACTKREEDSQHFQQGERSLFSCVVFKNFQKEKKIPRSQHPQGPEPLPLTPHPTVAQETHTAQAPHRFSNICPN